MKKKLLSLLTALIVVVAAHAEIIPILNESFENGIPTGWTQDTVTANASVVGWAIENTSSALPSQIAFDGQTRAYVRNTSSRSREAVVRLVTPAFNANVYQPVLTFAYAQPGKGQNNDSLKVYYRASQTDTWKLLVKYTEATSIWKADTVDLVGLSGTYQLAFEANINAGGGVVLDAVKVTESTQCTPVQGIGVVAMSQGAQINIAASLSTESFQVAVCTQQIANPDSHDFSVGSVYYNALLYDFVVDVTGLQPQTDYYVYVRSACPDLPSGYTEWVSQAFRTSYGFPFTEDFAASGLPTEWTRYRNALAELLAGDSLIAYNSGWSVSSGQLAGQATTSYNYIAMTPAIDLVGVDTGAIELRFDLSLASSAAGTTAVTNKSGLALYTVISEDGGVSWSRGNMTTISGEDAADFSIETLTTTPKRFRINMNRYIGEVVKIAFVTASTSGSGYFRMDNIAIQAYDPQCGDASKLRLTADVNAITASWTIMGKEDAVVEIADNAQFTSVIQSQNITSGTTFTFTNLTPATDYYVRVRQACEDAEWISAKTRTAVGLPYDNVFVSTTIPEGWTGYQGVTADDVLNGTPLPAPSTSAWSMKATPTYFSGMGSHVAYMNIYGTQKKWLVSPSVKINATAGQTVRVTFKHALSKSSNAATAPVFTDTDDEFAVLISTDGGQTWLPQNARTWKCDGTGDMDLTGMTQFPQRYSMDVTNLVGQSIRVALYGGSSASGSDNYIYVSDFAIETYDASCGGLSNLNIVQYTGCATAKWNYTGTQSAEVLLSKSATFADTVLIQTVTEDSLMFSNLGSNTQYYVRVRQTCSTEDYLTTTFRTPCGVIAVFPWTENFNTLTSGIPDCWTLSGTSSESYNWSSYSSGYEGKCLQFNSYYNTSGNTGLLHTPTININSDLILSFWYKNPKGGDFRVILGDSTTVLASGLTGAANWTYKEINLKPYRGQTTTIIFEAVSNWGSGDAYVYLDDITIEAAPTCDPMDNVTISSIASNGATIKHPTTNAAQYQIIIANTSINLDSLANYTDEVVYNQLMTGDMHPISGLESNTEYYVYVRGFCGGNDYGKWASEVTFRTLCAAVTPQAFGEETFSSASDFQCWTTGFMIMPDTLLSQSYAYADRSNISNYGYVLRLSKESTNSSYSHYKDGAYAVTGELDLGTDSINKYQVTFTAATNSQAATNVHRVSVGVVTNPGDLDTYTPIKIIDLEYAADSTEMSTYVVSFADYEGDYNGEYGRYVMFLSEAGDTATNYVMIDNLSFDVADGCQQLIELAIDSVTTTTARFSWEDAQAAQYEVFVSPFGGRADTIATSSYTFHTTVSTPYVTLTGLNPFSRYYAYVRALCGGDMGTGKWSSGKNFKTAIGVPFVETFDEMSTSNYPSDGWTSYRGTGVNGEATIEKSNLSVNSSTYGPYIMAVPNQVTNMAGNGVRAEIYSTSYNSMTVSPIVMIPAQAQANIGYRMTYRAAAIPYSGGGAISNATDHWLKVYVSTDGQTFHRISSWQVNGGDFQFNLIKSNAVRGEADLTNYAGQSVYLALATGTDNISTPDTYFWIDSIGVEEYNTDCGGAKNLTFTLNDSHSATATWELIGAPNATIVELSDASDFSNIIAQDSVVGALTKTFTDLQLSSRYYVRVRQACDGAEWISTFVTTPLGIPYSESFNKTALPEGWEQYKGDVASAFSGTAPVPGSNSSTYAWNIYSSSYGLDANHLAAYLYVSSYSDYGQEWILSPSIDLTDNAGDSLVCSYHMALTSSSAATAPTTLDGMEVRMLVSIDNGATWSAANSWLWNHNDSTGTAYEEIATIPNDGRDTLYSFDFSRFAGHIIRLAYYWDGPISADYYYARLHIGDLMIRKVVNGCTDPTGLTISNIGLRSADLSWTGDSSKVSVIEICDNIDFMSNVRRDTLAAGLTYTIQDLSPSSGYFVRVKQICNASDVTAYTATKSFRTLCGAIDALPWVEGFESYDAGSAQRGIAPGCWLLLNAQTATSSYPTAYVNNSSTYVNSGSQSLYFISSSSQPCVAICPEFAAPLDTLQVEFSYKMESTSSSGTITVGYITDVTNINSFVELNTYTQKTTFTTVKQMLNSVPAEVAATARLAFRYDVASNSNYYMGLDDIKVSYIPSCLNIETINLIGTTATTAVISHSNTGASAYEVLVTDAAINPSDTAAVNAHMVLDVDTFTTDTIVVSGLEAATTYRLYVRGICGDNDYSEWTDALVFTTECVAQSLPYSQDFNNLSSSSPLPICWTSSNTASAAAYYDFEWEYSTSGMSGTSCMELTTYYEDYDAEDVEYTATLASPILNIEDPARLTFMYKNADGAQFDVLAIVDGTTTSTIFSSNARVSAWKQAEIDLSNLVGHELQILFRAEVEEVYSYYGYDYSTLYLDNFNVTPIPATQTILAIEAVDVSRRTADLVWSLNPACECTNFELVVSATQLSDSACNEAQMITIQDTTAYRLTGLDRNTTYYLYIRTHCDTLIGDWASTTIKTKNLSACENYTIADGTETNSYVPVYGLYCDNPQRTQMIYPASMLTDLVGMDLTGVTFYVSSGSNASTWDDGIFTVRMGTTTATSVSSAFVTSPSQTVYTGTLTANTTDNMAIAFTTPFTYTGGNLLIEFDLPVEASSYLTVTFFGVEADGGPSRYEYNGYSDWTGSSKDFLPKANFLYCYQTEACPQVATVTAELTGDGTATATVSWTASEGDYVNTYDVIYADSVITDFTNVVPQFDSVAATTVDLTGLDEFTVYYVYVRANCDAEGHEEGSSTWNYTSFMTNSHCPVIHDLAADLETKTTTIVTWNKAYDEQQEEFLYYSSTTPMTDAELTAGTPDTVRATFIREENVPASTTLYYYVASNCGVEHSPYQMVSITTPDNCPAVANLHTVSVAFNAVTLAWNHARFAEEALWEVGIVGMEQYAETTADSIISLIGLNAETAYTAYVKAICGEGDTSVVATLAFTTAAPPAECLTVEGPTASADYTLPFSLYYKNGWTQSIYQAGQIGQAGTIRSLWYHFTSVPATALTDDEMTIYLAHTSMTLSASTTDWIPESDLIEVFSELNYTYPTDTGWIEFPLTSPFAYNGIDNLAVVCATKGTNYNGSYKLAMSSCPSGTSMYRQNDTDASYGEYPSSTGTQSTSIPVVQFCFEQEACAKPMNVTVSNLTETSATVTWMPGGSERSWNTVFSTTALTDIDLATAQMDTVTSMVKNFTGLTPDMDYYFYVRSVCSASLSGSWKEVHFITLPTCKVPEALTVDTVMATGVALSWTDMNNPASTSFTVVWGMSHDFDLTNPATYQTMDVTDTVYVVTGLVSNTLYTFAVRANTDTENSRWSTTVSTRTECGIGALPFHEMFEDITTGIPACWTLSGTTTTASQNWSSYNAGYTGSGLRFNSYINSAGNTGILTTPQLQLDTAATLTFMYKNPTGGNFKIMVNNTTVLDNLVGASDWTEEEVDLSPYAGQLITITFHATSNYGTGDAYVYLDDISVESASGCSRPTISVNDITLNTALLNWTGDTAHTYMLELSNDDSFVQDSVIMVIGATQYALTGLNAGAEYYARVRAICAEGDTSKVSKSIGFMTKFGIPFVQDFEGEVINGWTTASGSPLNAQGLTSGTAWSIASATSGVFTSSFAYSSVYYDYARSLFTPEILLNVEPGTPLRMTWHMALTSGTTSTTAPSATSLADREFAVAISVDGGESWSYSRAYTWKDNGGTQGAYSSIAPSDNKYSIDLSEYAGQSIMVAFVHSANGTSYTYSYILVDDVTINEYNAACQEVTNLAVNNVSMAGAEVSFNYAGTVHDAIIALSKSASFDAATAILVDTIYNDSTYTLPALDPSTKYYVYVAQLCAAGETSAWEQVSFSSPIGVPYYPTFTTALPEGWTRSNTEKEAVFAGTTPATYSGGWSVVSADAVIATPHAKLNIYGSSCHYWMISPSIDMTANVGQGVLLSFDAALCDYSYVGTSPEETDVDDIFMVAVSTDDGQTWQRRNATLWQDSANADYSYAGIPVTGQTYRLDMSAYAGHIVKIGFYGESSVAGADNDLHVGNIALTTCQATSYTARICDGDSYSGNGFTITPDQYEVGQNAYSRYTPATATAEEHLEVLSLTVDALALFDIYDTICAGAPYMYDETVYTEAGEVEAGDNVIDFFLTSVNGCDSIVTLHIYGLPVSHNTETAATCNGVPYEWHGQEYYLAGVYSDTMQSVSGCDSIATLILTVDEAITQEVTDYLCYQGSVVFEDGTSTTVAGDFTVEVDNEGGCATRYIHHVIEVGKLQSVKNAIICYGSTYSDDLFQGLSSDYSGSVTTTAKLTGCDSTVTLNLWVANEQNQVYVTVPVNELPFIVNNKIIIPEGTAEGDYDKTITTTACGDITAHIHVGEAVEKYTITVKAENGTANGGGIYVKGTEVQISVTPFNGYVFREWNDHNTENPRTITVTGDATYTGTCYEPEDGIDDVMVDADNARKIVRDQQLIIIVDDTEYNAQGKRMK